MSPHHPPSQKKLHRRHRQRGAAAIEFGFVFLIFFSVLYGIVSYGLAQMIKQGLIHAAAEGARASVRLDQMRFSTDLNYKTAVNQLARDAVVQSISWLPQKAKDKVTANITTVWSSGSRVVTTGGASPLTVETKTLTVTVSYPGYDKDPLIPALFLALPPNLVGTSSIQLQL